MAAAIHEFEGLRVRVDDVVYMPSLDAPPEKPHPFVYFISIHNDSPVPVTIRGRKWVVREDDGEVTVVDMIEAGLVRKGQWIFTRIPEFRLEVPNWA